MAKQITLKYVFYSYKIHLETEKNTYYIQKICAKFDRGQPLRGRKMHVGLVKIGDFRQITVLAIYLYGRGQGHVSNFYIVDLESFATASRRYTCR